MEQPYLPTPHNNFFQFALAHVVVARSLIEWQLPREALRHLNLDTLKLEAGTLLDLSQLTDAQIGGEPVLQSVLRLLKYSRSGQLPSKLREILELLSQWIQASGQEGWLQAIGVYVMAVNKHIGSEELNRIVKSVFPTQIEPGSLADRLLTQGREEGREVGREVGREEGKLTGKVQILQELLGEVVSTDAELLARPAGEVTSLLEELQRRLRLRR